MSAASRLILLLAGLAAASATCAAETQPAIEQLLSAEERQATGLDTLTPEQLALLNRLLREKARPAASAAAAPQGIAPPVEDDGSRVSGATPQVVPMDLEIRTIRSRLRGRIEGWAPGSEFRLDNGQTWKVLKGEIKLRTPLEAPEILVVPGIAGRWFLQVHEDYPKARVYRID